MMTPESTNDVTGAPPVRSSERLCEKSGAARVMGGEKFDRRSGFQIAGFLWFNDCTRSDSRCGASGSHGAEENAARLFQALCGTFTPTAAINLSKLTRFNTRLRL
jgi:hypothetical protein